MQICRDSIEQVSRVKGSREGNRSLKLCFLIPGEGNANTKCMGRAFGFDVFIRKGFFRVIINRGCAGNASKAKGYFATLTRGSRVASGIKLIVRFVCREPRFPYNRIQRILCYRCHETDVLHLPCTTNDKSLYLVLYCFDDAFADTLDRISTDSAKLSTSNLFVYLRIYK